MGARIATVDTLERQKLIDHYRDGGQILRGAVRSLWGIELDYAGPDGWTPRQVLHHLASNELIEGLRLRRMLREDSPELPGPSEPATPPVTPPEPVETTLDAFEAAVISNVELLEQLSEEQWMRTARRGQALFSIQDWLLARALRLEQQVAWLLRAAGRIDDAS